MKKLIVITGGTRGIGKAIAFRFATSGDFDVVTCSKNKKNVDRFKSECESLYPDALCYAWEADLSSKTGVESFLEKVNSLNRPVDILINNAGIFLPGTVLEEEEGVFEKLISLNLSSAYHITRDLGKYMKERREGYIFNICSTASITAYVNGGSYCISKFALYGMSKVLREELKEFNVKVTAVLPGATLTDSWAGVDLPPERFIKPEDVANSVFSVYSLSDQAVVEEILIRPQKGDI